MDAKIYSIIVDEEASRALLMLGMPPNILGSRFLKSAIKCGIADPCSITNLRKYAYKAIVEEYRTTEAHIERDIRHAIEVSKRSGAMFSINEMLGGLVYSGTENITVSQIISVLAEFVKGQVERRLVGFTMENEEEYLEELRKRMKEEAKKHGKKKDKDDDEEK